jgi:hypothetical protein
VLLHAYAGAGKTTTAAELARWYHTTGGFTPVLDANGVLWQTLDHRQRRQIAVRLLGAVPLLWIWDNVEPVGRIPHRHRIRLDRTRAGRAGRLLG